jgi:2',3'-cyclic-nucleotide 2'-phosphodiesterase (5'-nucleotidase family)
MRQIKTFFLPLIVLLVVSCSRVYQPISLQYDAYRISASTPADTNLTALIKPYADSMNQSMNEVVGVAEITLEKEQPESTLGNFMADAMLFKAKELFGQDVDAAFVNYGGIRLNQLPAGPVTKGKIFELMPFDNILIVQKLSGNLLQQFLDFTAARGGWPCAGISMEIENKKAVRVFIGNKLLDPTAEYMIANSDFVANGGDNADMLRAIPQMSKGYLVRDAIFDYIKKLKTERKNISAKKEKRVVHAQ